MYIIKIGGGDTINLEGIVSDLAELAHPFVIVHGANALRDQIAKRLGTPKQVLTSVSGFTSVYTDEQALDVIMMTYAGVRNKRLVELCLRQGINAVGLSGLDGKLIQGQKNRGIRVQQGDKTLIKRDLSGKPERVNIELIELLLGHGYTPVLTIPISDERGCAINSENDDIVNVLHGVLRAERIFQFIEAPGFLDHENDPRSLVTRLSIAELVHREQQVDGRMRRKMLALRKLFEVGPTEVIISDGRCAHPVKDALAGKGTVIV